MGQNWPNLALKSKILKYTCVICHFKGNFKQNTNSLLKIEKNVSKSSGGGFRGLLITKFEKFGPELIQYQHLICYSLLSRELNFECSKCFFGVRYCPPSLQEKFGPNLKKICGGGLYKYRESQNISSAHYNKKQCTVYTAMIYMNISGLRKEQSVIIISDNPKHTYKEVYCMNYVINNYLDTFFENRKINYFWSDGAPGMASI